jgi:hypothetical protein
VWAVYAGAEGETNAAVHDYGGADPDHICGIRQARGFGTDGVEKERDEKKERGRVCV